MSKRREVLHARAGEELLGELRSEVRVLPRGLGDVPRVRERVGAGEAHERAAGEPHGRPRVKLPSLAKLLHISHPD